MTKEVRNTPLAVFPHKRLPGFNGSNIERVIEPPNRGGVDAMQNAMSLQWPDDAHFVPYTMPKDIEGELVDADQTFRVNKAGLRSLHDNGIEPVCRWVVLDLDNPGHAGWTDEAERLFASLVVPEAIGEPSPAPELTELLRSAYVYTTNNGWRAMWALDEPIPASKMDSYLDQFLAHVDDLAGDVFILNSHLDDDDPPTRNDYFELDDNCGNWNQMFRLPRVNRDGYGDVSPEFEDTDNLAPLQWRPDDLEVRMTGSGAGEAGEDFDPDAEWPVGHEDDLKTAKAALDIVSPDVSRHEWLNVGRALEHTFGDAAFELWHEWSKQGDKWQENGPGELERNWRGFGDRDNPVTLGTLVHLADEAEGSKDWRPSRKMDAPANKLEQLADAVGKPRDTDPHELRKFLILYSTTRAQYYVWSERKGYYVGPVRNGAAMKDFISTHCPSFLDPHDGPHLNKQGNLLRMDNLLESFGSPITRFMAKLGVEGCHYDHERQILTEGTATVDPRLAPEYNEQVAQWLTLLGADRADELRDWLATFLDFERPTCAIYIDGPPSIGKGMLTAGLSRLFDSKAAVPYSDAMDDFNSLVKDCPLVVADEKVPQGLGDEAPSQAIKRFLGSSGLVINEKYVQKMELEGVPRLLITANDDSAFSVSENVTEHTRKAIERRIGYIETNNEAGAYIETIGGYDTTKAWVAGGAIARHVLWLHENHDVDKGSRFLVEGWPSKFTADFGAREGLAGAVVGNLIEYVMSGNYKPAMPVEGGQLLVSMQCLADSWDDLTVGDQAIPSRNKLSEALKQVAVEGDDQKVRKRISTTGSRPRLWNIDLAKLVRAAERLNLAAVDELLDNLEVAEGTDERRELEELARSV